MFDLQGKSDEALLAAFVRTGDRPALETLISRHEGRVFNIAFRLLGNRADALDATQDVFLSVFRRAGTFKHQSSFSTWLYRLTVNACYDLGRKKTRSAVPAETVDSPAPDPADAIDAGLDVHRALQYLAPDQRAAVIMRDLFEMSLDEIAAATGVPLGTVKSRIARGRLALAARLSQRGAAGQADPQGRTARNQGAVDSSPGFKEPAGPSDRLNSKENK